MAISDLVPWKRGTKQVPVNREATHPMLGLQQSVNRLFDEFFDGFGLTPFVGDFVPQVDMVENDREFKVSVELPGLEEKDVNVTLAHNLLTISGEKKEEKEDKGKNYYRMERSYGSFRRSIPLPDEVEADKAEATFKKGVLTVNLPKTAEAQNRKRISIKTR